jgi:hypothetical protein
MSRPTVDPRMALAMLSPMPGIGSPLQTPTPLIPGLLPIIPTAQPVTVQPQIPMTSPIATPVQLIPTIGVEILGKLFQLSLNVINANERVQSARTMLRMNIDEIHDFERSVIQLQEIVNMFVGYLNVLSLQDRDRFETMYQSIVEVKQRKIEELRQRATLLNDQVNQSTLEYEEAVRRNQEYIDELKKLGHNFDAINTIIGVPISPPPISPPLEARLQPLPNVVMPQRTFDIKIPITKPQTPEITRIDLAKSPNLGTTTQVITPPEVRALPPEMLSPKTLTSEIEVGTPVEQFIETVIFEQDADIAEEKEYLGYVKYLLDADIKYDVFARLHPEFTCEKVGLKVFYIGSKDRFRGEEGATFYGQLKANDNIEQGAAIRVYPSLTKLQMCVVAAESQNRSVAIYLEYENHANMIWIDTKNKIINRYDPQVPATERYQELLDVGIRVFFATTLPEYQYLGNTQEDFLCVQGIRGADRIHKSDYFCQDYSLLYAERRAKGMTHEEAAFDLVANADNILLELAELLRQLTYKKRLEIGKPVPRKYQGEV